MNKDLFPTCASELLTMFENDKCADCGSYNVEFISLRLNAFICPPCKEYHELVYTSQHIRALSDPFTHDELRQLKLSGGNVENRHCWEAALPPYYRRPFTRCPPLLRREFIFAKYRRMEFKRRDASGNSTKLHSFNSLTSNGDDDFSDSNQKDFSRFSSESTLPNTDPNNSYLFKRGILLKRLRDVDKYYEKMFELSMRDNYLRYSKVDDKKAKASLDLDRLNVTILDSQLFQVPENSMLINYVADGSTRNIFVSSEVGSVILSWYQAIRGAKFHRALLHITGSGDRPDVMSVASSITYDYSMCGYLEKTGPQQDDAWRKRWCMLGKRRLVYNLTRHCPYPRGEILIGLAEDGYQVKLGSPENWKKHSGYTFTLITPDRTFVFQEPDSRDVRDRWVEAIQRVIRSPMTNEDRKQFVAILPKRRGGFSILH